MKNNVFTDQREDKGEKMFFIIVAKFIQKIQVFNLFLFDRTNCLIGLTFKFIDICSS